MINWLRNKLRNFVLQSDDAMDNHLSTVSVDEDRIEESNTLKFSVTSARGGIIVQVRHYDNRRDETNYVTHVIHDDEHVSERVAEIVSMSLLRA
jgi:hypothetical protein